MSVGRIVVDLLARTGSFETDLNRAAKLSAKRAKEIDAQFKAAGKAIGIALVAGATAAAIAIKSSIDRMDELSKAAQKIGVTTEAISRLAYAADLSDVSIEQLQGGLAKLVKYQAEAAQGGKEAAATFTAFGIAIKDNAGNLRDTESVLQDFARVFSELPDGPEKTALALRVFGKAGAELIPLLNSGADGLADMSEEADRLGITISTKAGKQAEQFNDDLTTLKANVTGVATQIAIDLLPNLLELTGELKDGGEAARDFSGFADGMATVFGFVADAAGVVVDVVQGLTSTVIGLIEAANIAFKLQQGDFKGAKQAATNSAAEFRQAGSDLGITGPTARRAKAAGTNTPGGAIDFIMPPESRGSKATQDAARKLLATNTTATKENTDAKKAAADAARKAAQAQDELNDQIEAAFEASADFKAQLEDLTAQLGGPLAESALRYRREEEALTKLWSEGTTPNAEELEQALTALHIARDADAEAIRKSLDTGGERLKQLQAELDILNMTTQAERDRAAFMLENPNAKPGQADAAAALLAKLDATRQAINAADELRGSFTDAFSSILDGSKSAKDAFTDLADSVVAQIARMIAQQWVTQIFGAPGAPPGGGSQGGIFSSLLGAFLPGFANGTNYAPGGLAVVGERGPEIVNLPKGSSVTPNNKIGRGAPVINITVAGNTTRETAQQIANKVGQTLAFSGRGS